MTRSLSFQHSLQLLSLLRPLLQTSHIDDLMPSEVHRWLRDRNVRTSEYAGGSRKCPLTSWTIHGLLLLRWSGLRLLCRRLLMVQQWRMLCLRLCASHHLVRCSARLLPWRCRLGRLLPVRYLVVMRIRLTLALALSLVLRLVLRLPLLLVLLSRLILGMMLLRQENPVPKDLLHITQKLHVNLLEYTELDCYTFPTTGGLADHIPPAKSYDFAEEKKKVDTYAVMFWDILAR